MSSSITTLWSRFALVSFTALALTACGGSDNKSDNDQASNTPVSSSSGSDNTSGSGDSDTGDSGAGGSNGGNTDQDEKPFSIRKNPFAKVTSSYVVVPYNKDGLGETYTRREAPTSMPERPCKTITSIASTFCYDLVTSGDGIVTPPQEIQNVPDRAAPVVGIERQSVPIFPFLLVKDDGQCIVASEGSNITDITDKSQCPTQAKDATRAQKKAYLERVSLSAEEWATLDIAIKGFSANEQPLPNLVLDSATLKEFNVPPDEVFHNDDDLDVLLPAPSPCHDDYPCYLLRKPDINSSETDEAADAKRFTIASEQTDFFSKQLNGYKQYEADFVAAHSDDLKATYKKDDTSDWQYVYDVEQEIFAQKYQDKAIPVLSVGRYAWKGIHLSDASFVKERDSFTGDVDAPLFAKISKQSINMHHFPPVARSIVKGMNSFDPSMSVAEYANFTRLPAMPVMLYPLDIEVKRKATDTSPEMAVNLEVKLFNVAACRGVPDDYPIEGKAADETHLFDWGSKGYDPESDATGDLVYKPHSESLHHQIYDSPIYSQLRTNHAAPKNSFIERLWSAKKQKYDWYNFEWIEDESYLNPRPELLDAFNNIKTDKGLSAAEFDLANAILNLCPSAKDVSQANGAAKN